MSKACLCISGHLRSYKRAKESYKNFVEILNSKFESLDIFLATWDKTEAQSSWASSHGLVSQRTDTDEKDLIEAFKPSKYLIFDDDFYSSSCSPLNFNLVSLNKIIPSETNNEYFQSKRPELINNESLIKVDKRMVCNEIPHIFKMCFLKHELLKIKKNHEYLHNKTYDICFYSRPEIIYDNAFINKIDFESIIDSNINKNYVCSDLSIRNGWDKKYPAIKDKCLFGGDFGMNIFMNTFLFLPAYFYNNEWPDGEFANAQNLINFNTKIIGFPELGLLSNDSHPSLLR